MIFFNLLLSYSLLLDLLLLLLLLLEERLWDWLLLLLLLLFRLLGLFFVLAEVKTFDKLFFFLLECLFWVILLVLLVPLAPIMCLLFKLLIVVSSLMLDIYHPPTHVFKLKMRSIVWISILLTLIIVEINTFVIS
jgi:hypothetical protein